MKVTTLFGTFEDSFVDAAINQFAFLPKVNEKGFSEKEIEEVFAYAIDRLWYSEVSLEDAKNFMREAIVMTDLYKDDPDRKDKVSDMVERQYSINARSPPLFYDPDLDAKVTLKDEVTKPKIVNGHKKLGFGELTKPYDVQINLRDISVLLESYGKAGEGSWSSTSAEFHYDERAHQSRIFYFITGERKNKDYDEQQGPGPNNKEYVTFSETRSKTYLGDIRILGIARTEKDDKVYYSINGTRYLDTLIDARDRMVSTTSAPKSGQLLFIILSSLVRNDGPNKYDFIEAGFHIDEKIRIKRKDSWPTGADMPYILAKINDFYHLTTNPNAFRIKLYYDLFGPFSYKLRQSGILFPILFLWGESRGGKTQLAAFFNSTGWDNPKANLTEKNAETKYTALKQLSNKYTSILLDEVSNSFLQPLEHFLNSASTGIGSGSRGGKGSNKLDLWEYEVLAWLTMTTNDTISLGKAFNNRLMVIQYDQGNVERQNVQAFEKIKSEFPKGWMYALFDDMFGGKSTGEIISELVQGVVREEDQIPKMLGTVEKKLMETYARYGVRWEFEGAVKWARGFPSDYLPEIFQYFKQAAEWTEQSVFKGYNGNGEEIPVDKFNKFGFNVDFFREKKKKMVVGEDGQLKEADVEGYFITLKAFKQFCKDADVPKDLRTVENFAAYVGKKERLKVTSSRLVKESSGETREHPVKGLMVLDPFVKLAEEIRTVEVKVT